MTSDDVGGTLVALQAIFQTTVIALATNAQRDEVREWIQGNARPNTSQTHALQALAQINDIFHSEGNALPDDILRSWLIGSDNALFLIREGKHEQAVTAARHYVSTALS